MTFGFHTHTHIYMLLIVMASESWDMLVVGCEFESAEKQLKNYKLFIFYSRKKAVACYSIESKVTLYINR